MKNFGICRVHQAATHEWRSSEDDNELTCVAYDLLTGNLYTGQLHGHICQINIHELGTYSPRLLGKHGGIVKAMCIYPYKIGTAVPKISLVASGSADSTIKIWAHDPRVLHSTKPCIQTLCGHTSAVTCVTAVHQYLVSGAVDGSVLLWRPSGTGLLALPQFHAAATLWSGHHWVLSLSCQQQQAEVGAGQGVFVAIANQPLLRLSFNKSARQSDDCSQMKTDVHVFAQPYDASSARKSCKQNQQSTQKNDQRQQPPPCNGFDSAMRSNPSSTDVADGCQMPGSDSANKAADLINASISIGRPATPGSDYTSNTPPQTSRTPTTVVSSCVSLFAVQYIAHQLAVLTLAYDGCCRVHSAVDGGLLCKWHSHGRSSFTAMDCTGTMGEVLLGDDQGALHVYSLGSEQLLAVKQLTHSRLTAILCCGTRRSSNGSDTSNIGSAGSTKQCQAGIATQFVVLSPEGLGLWELRRGLSHEMLPGGHRQAVFALQVCQSNIIDMQSSVVPSVSRGDESVPDLNPAISSSRDVAMLISAGLDNKVLQWDIAASPSVITSPCVQSIGSELSAMTFLQGWTMLATGHENGQVCLWRLDTGTKVLLDPSAHSNTVCCLTPVVTKAEELLLSASFDGCVTLWEPRLLRGIKPHMLARFQAFGLSTQELYGAYHLALMAALSSSSGSMRAAQSTNSSRSQSAAVRCRTKQISAGSQKPSTGNSSSTRVSSPVVIGAEHLAHISGGDATTLVEMLQSRTTSAAVRPGDVYKATVLRQQSGRKSPTTSTQTAAAFNVSLAAEAPEVLVAVFDNVQQVLVTAGNAEAIRVWSGNCTGELLGEHIGHTGPINCLKLDGNLLFSGSDDTTIRMWDLLPPHFVHRSTGTAAQAAEAVGAAVAEGATAAGAANFAGSSCSQKLQTLRVSSSSYSANIDACGMERLKSTQQAGPTRALPAAMAGAVPSSIAFQVLHGHTAAVTGLDMVRSTGVLVSCGKDGRVLQWNYSNWQLLREQNLSDAGLLCLSIHQIAKRAYVGTSSGQILCVDLTAVVQSDTTGSAGALRPD